MKMFMEKALSEAELALKSGEIPVGAVIVKDGKIISFAHNEREKNNIATHHAEILAIERACSALSSWRLNGCDLYVTLEPCIMCASAIVNARIGRVFFGAYDSQYGGCGGKIDVINHVYKANVQIYGGIMEEECEALINEAFKNIRE